MFLQELGRRLWEDLLRRRALGGFEVVRIFLEIFKILEFR